MVSCWNKSGRVYQNRLWTNLVWIQASEEEEEEEKQEEEEEEKREQKYFTSDSESPSESLSRRLNQKCRWCTAIWEKDKCVRNGGKTQQILSLSV